MSDGAAIGLVTGGVFAALGTAIFLWGRSFRALDRAIGRWPTAPGTIATSRDEAHDGVTRDAQGYDVASTSYVPVVTYDYEVAGTRYTGTKVSRSTGAVDAPSVKRVLDRYPPRATVAVLYDPANPATAYLEEGRSWGAMFLMIFGGVFIAAGTGTLALVLLAR